MPNDLRRFLAINSPHGVHEPQKSGSDGHARNCGVELWNGGQQRVGVDLTAMAYYTFIFW